MPSGFADLNPAARRFLRLRVRVWTIRLGVLAILLVLLVKVGVVHG